MTVLSIDGKAIRLEKFVASVHKSIEITQKMVDTLFGKCRYDDILKHIDSGLDADDPDKWFREHPQDNTRGRSIFNEPSNDFRQFRLRLLAHMCKDMNYFVKTDTGVVAKQGKWQTFLLQRAAHRLVGNIGNWFGLLDKLQTPLYFAMVSTWGGGARGTECDHLQFEVNHNGHRHFYLLNGMITIVTTYVKTQSHHRRGRQIARAIPWQLARLMMLIYGVIYPAASHLAAYLFDSQIADNYMSYMFVYHGKVADAATFSKFLKSFTDEYLGIPLGLRDWRQVMCTIMVNILKADFGYPDDDVDMKAIHDQFAHSRVTAEKKYALQISDALEEVSQTAVASHQRISKLLHDLYRLNRHSKPPSAVVNKDEQPAPLDLSEVLGPLKQAIEDAGSSSLASMANLTSHTISFLQGFASEFLQRFAYVQSGNDRPIHVPPITVDPRLAEKVSRLFPRVERFQFSMPEQAEALQSCSLKKHVLVVMPTGSGKSLAFFGAPCIFPDKMFIVITPLVALTEDMARRLAMTRIRGGKLTDIIDPFAAQLVLVSAHQAGGDNFYRWVISNRERIGRIFIDEAHHIIISDNYRPCFHLFEMLTRTGVPITFLTATIFPKSVPYLCEKMRIDPSLLYEIRASTIRPNIKMSRSKCANQAQALSCLKDMFPKISLKPEERGLIFCTTIIGCQTISNLLKIPYYVARMNDDPVLNYEERAKLDKQWRDGVQPDHRWIVATLCFGQGIDYSGVRWVIHVEANSLLNYTQEIGRAGRDGSRSFAHLIFSTLPPISFADPHDNLGVLPMRDFLQIEQCRRISIHGPLDGYSHSCASIPNAELCDYCESISQVSFLYFKRPRSNVL